MCWCVFGVCRRVRRGVYIEISSVYRSQRLEPKPQTGARFTVLSLSNHQPAPMKKRFKIKRSQLRGVCSTAEQIVFQIIYRYVTRPHEYRAVAGRRIPLWLLFPAVNDMHDGKSSHEDRAALPSENKNIPISWISRRLARWRNAPFSGRKLGVGNKTGIGGGDGRADVPCEGKGFQINAGAISNWEWRFQRWTSKRSVWSARTSSFSHVSWQHIECVEPNEESLEEL